MAAEILIDTGAILALIDKSDEWHQVCVNTLPYLPMPFLTSEAVLTELFHFLERQRLNKEPAWRFLNTGIIAMAPIQHAELRHLQRLMSRYSDRPMDFADATLVYLAERESIDVIFAVDRPDFSIYRIGNRRRFRVFPLEGPASAE